MARISRAANISHDREERFSLSRTWDLKKPKVLYIMLNPSYADDKFDDPTIRRLIFFSKKFKYGGFYVANLFTQITPYPKLLNMENDIKFIFTANKINSIDIKITITFFLFRKIPITPKKKIIAPRDK